MCNTNLVVSEQFLQKEHPSSSKKDHLQQEEAMKFNTVFNSVP